MLYDEEAYFNGNHCAHVAAYYNHMRLQRIHKQCVAVFTAAQRNRNRYYARQH